MGRLASAKALTSTNTVLQTTHNKLIDLLDAGYIVEGNVNDHIIRVEVTPSGGFKIFRDDVLVSGIDASGNAIFSGDISAASGTFSGTVSGATINGGTINGTAIYIPNSTSPVFSVNSSGTMNASSGTFSGSVAGGSISIPSTSPKFYVDSAGNMTAADAYLTGSIATNGGLDINNGGLYVEGVATFDDTLVAKAYIEPDSDNTRNLGKSGRRFREVWAANGTIQTSDRDLKTNIQAIEKGVEFVLGLTPVQYQFIDGTSGRIHKGFIAQDVKSLMDKLGIDFGGYIDPAINGNPGENDGISYNKKALRYDEFIAPMVQTIQYLEQRIKDLENKLGSV